MRTKNQFAALILALAGALVFIGCAGSGGTIPLVIPTVAPAPTVVSATSAPTALPTIPPDAAATAAAIATATTEPASTSIVEYVTARDGGAELFNDPVVVTMDTGGNLYVLEGSNRILKYDKAGNFVTKWGSYGSGDGQFNFGWGGDIAIDSSGNLFVTDLRNNRVQKFDPDGKFLSKWGKSGMGDGEFVGPMGIAVDSRGNVYVTDTNRDPSWNIRVPGSKENVQVFDGNGKFLAKWGTPGDGLGLLNIPTDIEIDSADNVYVTSQYGDWINKFDTEGNSLGGWNTCGPVPASTLDPTGLAIDQQGNVYVAHLASRLICKFTAEGEYLGSWGSQGSDDGQFLTMADLAVAEDGTIYVPDIAKNQILIFKQK